jgi:hypothetical protein
MWWISILACPPADRVFQELNESFLEIVTPLFEAFPGLRRATDFAPILINIQRDEKKILKESTGTADSNMRNLGPLTVVL